jgi:hypothetical protein
MESINKIRLKADQISPKSKALLIYTILTGAAALFAFNAEAQTFAEWFSQKKTQKKYLLQQIAALQIYSGYLKQGYNIANHGLGSITGSLKEELNLHTTYYDKLKAVNAVVKNNPQVNEILIWQKDILNSMGKLGQTEPLTNDQKSYIGRLKQALLNDCAQQMTELQDLLTDGKLEMSDEERISRLNKIHRAMQDNFRFAAAFNGQVQLYVVQVQQETRNTRTSKNLYGIR